MAQTVNDIIPPPTPSQPPPATPPKPVAAAVPIKSAPMANPIAGVPEQAVATTENDKELEQVLIDVSREVKSGTPAASTQKVQIEPKQGEPDIKGRARRSMPVLPVIIAVIVVTILIFLAFSVFKDPSGASVRP